MLRCTAVLLLCVSMLQAQEPAPAPVTVFSVSTTLVQVDSVVTDPQGHQVTNLKPDDFQVLVDGKPQAVTHFSYIHLDSAEVNRPSASAQLKPQDIRRCTVLVVDDLSLSFDSMARVREILKRFIDEQMPSGDLVALWETGRRDGVFQPLTSDKRLLQAAVEKLHWNQLLDHGRFNESMIPDYTGDSEQQREPPTNLVNERAYSRRILTLGTLGSLGQLMDELRPVSGRKAVVLFSDGIDLLGITIPANLPNSYHDDALTRFRRVIDKANRSGAVVYAVDVRGLVALKPGTTGGLWSSQQGLLRLAYETGGFAAVNSNALSSAVQRIEDQEKGYYLIGFKAPENISTVKPASKAGYHSIKVSVNVHGLEVRSRSGFFGETDEVANRNIGPFNKVFGKPIF